jgi:diaminopropionate ammonia-lyase
MRAVVNPAVDRTAVPRPDDGAAPFHRGLPGYAPTPVHRLDGLAAEIGVGAVQIKDESDRLGLPAFKILGASWAVERTLRERPDVHTLVAARAAEDDGTALIADVGPAGGPPEWVIDGYATLFSEAAGQADHDLVIVPVGVGSLAAAAARHGALTGAQVVGVEPVTAACLGASLARGGPTPVRTPGTVMAGLDCAEVSPAAWPSLQRGIAGSVAVDDAEATAAMDELAAYGLTIGECGAAALAGVRALLLEDACRDLRVHLGVDARTRVLLIGTEGHTGAETE